MKLLKTLKKIDLFTYLAIFFCFAFILAGSIVSVVRYWQYEVFYYDFGIFDSAIWKVAHFHAPIIDHLVVGGKWIFADHFSPSIFLLSPLYWFTNRPEIILISQAFAVGTSGFVLYIIGKNILKSRFLSLSITICYLLFLGLQNAVITDFHEVTVATLPFMLVFLGIIKKNKWLYFISLVVFLGFKESNFLVGIGIALSILFIYREWWKIALGTILLSAVWGYLAVHVIIPFFSGGHYYYQTDVSLNPFVILSRFFNSPIKLHTLWFSFLSFGFLPIFSPAFCALLFQDFLTRFYPSAWDTRWDLGLHYSALFSAYAGISSIFGLKWIIGLIKKKSIEIILGIILIINAVFLYRFILYGPFALSYNSAFYAHTKDFEFLNRLTSLVPNNASVMAPNNIVSHFTHQTSYIVRGTYKDIYPGLNIKFPEYILLDERPGQNPNDDFGTGNESDLLNQLKIDPNYLLFYKKGDQYAFRLKYL